MRTLSLLLVLIFSLCLPPAMSQNPVTVQKTTLPPVIDGKLNDPAWKGLQEISGFKSYVPDFGADAAFATRAYMTYDPEYIYIGFDCTDPEPDKIKATISARDQIKNEDWVCVNFDPFFDQQSLVTLYINPFGIQADGRSSASKEDMGVDYVFSSAGNLDNNGYQVEIAIPFKSLRYPAGDTVVMGFIFERRIQRLSQQSTSPPLSPEKGMNFLTQTMGFSFSGIKHYTLMELLPAVTYSFKQVHQSGNLSITENKPSIGLTGTIGLTSQLVLDMALNPDFSQVESDAGQITENQRYALFYPEKRPFFQEGKSNFEIAGTSEMGFFQQAFHTRQISNPLAGIKLTGKISEQNRVGLLYALDEPLEDPGNDSINRFVHYAVGRIHHAFEDDSYLGATATMREGVGMFNRVAGLDGRWRVTPSLSMEFNALTSSTLEENQPESRADWMATAKIARNTNRLSGEFQIQHIGVDFQTKTGFLLRSGVNNAMVMLDYSIYRNTGFIRRNAPMIYAFINQDIAAGLWERDLGLGWSVYGQRSTHLSLMLNPSDEVYQNQRFRTHSIHIEGFSQIIRSLRVQTQYRFGYRTRYTDNPFTGWGHTAEVDFNFQPVDKFQSDLSLNYSDFYHLNTNQREFSYLILRSRNTYQVTPKFFVRGIVEYNSYEKDLTTDFLLSFTYIPGTVVHLGYGSLYQKTTWNGHEYQPGSTYLETVRGLFFKASYLWRR